jgi:hypothetical protein
MIETVGVANRQIVNAGVPVMHQAFCIEFPVFVSVRSIPLCGIVVPLIGKSHGDPGSVERPHFLDQTVVQFLVPLARQKLNDFFPAVHEFRTVAPQAIHRIRQRDALRVPRIPAVLGLANFFNRGLACEGRH